MKKFLVAVGFMFAASIVSAQETYNIDATAQQQADLIEGIDAFNTRVCKRWALAPGCTKAQACVAAVAAGGASCTNTQARAAKAMIYDGTTLGTVTSGGRMEFVKFEFNAARFADLKAVVPAMNQYKACLKWQTDNATARNASCAAAGQANGCSLYGTTCQ